MNFKEIMNDFSDDDIRMLAEQERKMDSGESPYVTLRGNRMAMTQESMDHFKLTQGQTINEVIMMKILEFNISFCQARIETEKLMENAQDKNAA